MKNIEIIKIPCVGYECNCFLIKIKNNAVLVDCGINFQTIQKTLHNNNINLTHVILTHGHYDHISSLTEIEKQYPEAEIIISEEDSEFLKRNNHFNLAQSLFKIDFQGAYFTKLIKENCTLTILDNKFEFFLTPGHTNGSMIICFNNNMFTGDSVFNLSVGRCDFPSGDYAKQKRSIEFIKNHFCQDYILYCGHGENSTLNFEKQYNPYFNPNSPYEDLFEH
ncbi:MAG: MBL fold metallo-hydrolase [Oscillospiraceae bacterium]